MGARPPALPITLQSSGVQAGSLQIPASRGQTSHSVSPSQASDHSQRQTASQSVRPSLSLSVSHTTRLVFLTSVISKQSEEFARISLRICRICNCCSAVSCNCISSVYFISESSRRHHMLLKDKGFPLLFFINYSFGDLILHQI